MGAHDIEFFDLLLLHPERMESFNEGMAGTSIPVAATYKFDELRTEEGGVVMVDTGGGKGQTTLEFRDAYPNMRGRFVLQDLKPVLDAGVIVSPDEVGVQPYNFLAKVQPIKGDCLPFTCSRVATTADKLSHRRRSGLLFQSDLPRLAGRRVQNEPLQSDTSDERAALQAVDLRSRNTGPPAGTEESSP